MFLKIRLISNKLIRRLQILCHSNSYQAPKNIKTSRMSMLTVNYINLNQLYIYPQLPKSIVKLINDKTQCICYVGLLCKGNLLPHSSGNLRSKIKTLTDCSTQSLRGRWLLDSSASIAVSDLQHLLDCNCTKPFLHLLFHVSLARTLTFLRVDHMPIWCQFNLINYIAKTLFLDNTTIWSKNFGF